MARPHFAYWPNEYLSGFHFSATMSSAAMNICEWLFVWTLVFISLGYFPGVSNGITTFSHLNKVMAHFLLTTALWGGYTIIISFGRWRNWGTGNRRWTHGIWTQGLWLQHSRLHGCPVLPFSSDSVQVPWGPGQLCLWLESTLTKPSHFCLWARVVSMPSLVPRGALQLWLSRVSENTSQQQAPAFFLPQGYPWGTALGTFFLMGRLQVARTRMKISFYVCMCVCVCARACVHALLVSPLHQCQVGSLAWPLQAYLPQGRLEVAEVTWSPLPFVSFEKQVEVMTRSSGWTGHRGQGEAEPAPWWTNEVAQSCLTLCDPTDCSLPGSSIHGIFQARELKWVAISFSRKIFPTQGLNPGLPHCRQTLYCLSHQGSQESTVVGLRYVCKVGVGVAPATHFLFQGKLSFNGMIL